MTAWFLLSALAFAETRDVRAAPSEVTVFADRAEVTRSASVELPAGRQEVAFVGLPIATIGGSVTADAVGPGELTGIDLLRVTATQAADERVAEIEKEIEKLEDERRVYKDLESIAGAELRTIGTSRTESAEALSNQLLYGTDAPGRSRSLRTAFSREDATVRAEMRSAQRKGREIDEKIDALRRERTSLGSSGTDTWTAIVHVDLARAGRMSIDLTYLVSYASWRPTYDLRGDADTGKVDLSLSALVTQSTGEDWKDVKLTVSSAQPGLGTVVPRLDPFWLQPPAPVYYPAATVSRSSAPAGKAMAMEMEAEPMAPPPAPMVVAQAAVKVDLAATSFEVARPEDIAADGTERKVLLTTKLLDADLRHVVVPRLDPRAYLVGKVTNTAEFPLLSGEAGVFLSDAYLGDFQMETVPPGEKFDIAFGVDDHVAIKRTPAALVVGDTKPGTKRAVSQWKWNVRVKNGHRRPIKVEVREQVPISTNDDVKVTWEVAADTPAPTAEDSGFLRFDFELSSGKDRTLTWGYKVEYPADAWMGWME